MKPLNKYTIKKSILILSLILLPLSTLVSYQISAAASKSRVMETDDIPSLLERPIENPVTIWKGGIESPDYEKQNKITHAIGKHFNSLFHANSPFVGPKNSAVTIVEFFDYQCSHCQKMAPVLSTLQKNNPNLKIIYKDIPILGANSTLAAKAALAAHKQGKYSLFSHKLLEQSPPIVESKIREIAEQVGLNMKQFETDMDSDQINQELDDHFTLAKALMLTGTPVFLIVNETKENPKHSENQERTSKAFYVSGDSSLEVMQDLVNQAGEE